MRQQKLDQLLEVVLVKCYQVFSVVNYKQNFLLERCYLVKNQVCDRKAVLLHGVTLFLGTDNIVKHRVILRDHLVVEGSEEDFAVLDATGIQQDVATRQQHPLVDVLDRLASKARLTNARQAQKRQQTARFG